MNEPFQVGEEYEDGRGTFRVVRIQGSRALVRYRSGKVSVLDLSAAQTIARAIPRDAEVSHPEVVSAESGDDTSIQYPHVAVEVERFNPAEDIQWLLDADEVSEWLGLPVERVRAMAEAGDLPGRQLRGDWRFGIATLNLWAEGTDLGDLVRDAIARAAIEVATIGRVDVTHGEIEFLLDEPITLEELEKAYLEFALKHFQGNKTRVAERVGIDPSTLYRKIKRYGLEKSPWSS